MVHRSNRTQDSLCVASAMNSAPINPIGTTASTNAARGRGRQRTAVTIVELLVSVALTLIVILAIVRVFDLLGGNVTQSRSILELSAQLRNVSAQVQTDLDRLTASPSPQLHASTSMGYFEIIEGIRNERDNDGDGEFDLSETEVPPTAPITSILQTPRQGALPGTELLNGMPLYLQQTRGILGDTDDIFMGTIRSDDEPFRGRLFNPTTNQYIIVESKTAEVVYWLAPVEFRNQFGEFALVRRLLLIQPKLPPGLSLAAVMANMRVTTVADLQNFVAANDISMRPEYNPAATRVTMKANTLADLRVRRNRFAHWGNLSDISQANQLTSRQNTFPDYLNRTYLVHSSDATNLRDPDTGYLIPDGNDIVAQDLVGFDLRVFDPLAPVYRPNPTSRYVLTPQDRGFYSYMADSPPQPNLPASNYGAYVDLGYGFLANGNPRPGVIASHFSGVPNFKSRLFNTSLNQFARIYDTWTEEYEQDGIDQNAGLPPSQGGGVADEGRNGMEDALFGFVGNNGFSTDDYLERETLPPYNFPLQGMEVVVRMREASSNQVRQASVVTNFGE